MYPTSLLSVKCAHSEGSSGIIVGLDVVFSMKFVSLVGSTDNDDPQSTPPQKLESNTLMLEDAYPKLSNQNKLSKKLLLFILLNS